MATMLTMAKGMLPLRLILTMYVTFKSAPCGLKAQERCQCEARRKGEHSGYSGCACVAKHPEYK